MAEPYVGDLGIAMQFVQSWLGGSSPTFAAMGGSSSSIIMGEWPGGTPPATTQAFLFPEPGDWDRVQPEVFLGQCQVHVDILSSPTGLNPQDAFARVLGQMWNLRVDLAAAAIAANCNQLRRIACSSAPIRLEPTAAKAAWWQMSLSLVFLSGNC